MNSIPPPEPASCSYPLRAGLFGIVNEGRAVQAGRALRQADAEEIFLHVTTCSPSSIGLPVVQRAKVPVIILSFRTAAAIDSGCLDAMQNRARVPVAGGIAFGH